MDSQTLNIKKYNLLIFLISMNTALLVASNAGGSKLIELPFGLAASATVFSYALSFTFTDIISEIYGKKEASFAVKIGFLGLIISVIFFTVSIFAPPAIGWDGQEAYQKTLGLGPRLLAGGWLSYLVSQHLDVWLFHRIKKYTSGKHLWLRNNASTLISQFVDSTIFITVAFWGVFPILPVILGQYILKLIIALLDTPVVYFLIFFIRRYFNDKENT